MTRLDRIILTHRALFTRGSDIATAALVLLALVLAVADLTILMNLVALVVCALCIFRIRTAAIINVWEENLYHLATR